MDSPVAPQLISQTTVLSLLLTVVLLSSAYAVSLAVLPARSTTKTRGIYIWHIFNSLTHLILEGSFLYYSLVAWSPVASDANPTLYGNPAVSYGTKFSTAPLARLWQEYSKADVRWAEADVVVVCIEVITVLVGGPLAFLVSEMVRKGEARRWFWMTILATGEIYGGWMTFGPEWLSGNHKLVTEVWMYKWLYLAFFNGLWVVVPGWLLWESYSAMTSAVEKVEKLEKTVDIKEGRKSR